MQSQMSTQLPRITIITPSFNQGTLIEETIKSVVDQGYPDLEYIVIDGGSTDCTRNVLEQYDDRISYWVSEADRGQAHAINKGLAGDSRKHNHWIVTRYEDVARALDNPSLGNAPSRYAVTNERNRGRYTSANVANPLQSAR